jgi:hypothetical protein
MADLGPDRAVIPETRKNPCFGKEGMTIRSYPTGEDAEGIFDSARIRVSDMIRDGDNLLRGRGQPENQGIRSCWCRPSLSDGSTDSGLPFS